MASPETQTVLLLISLRFSRRVSETEFAGGPGTPMMTTEEAVARALAAVLAKGVRLISTTPSVVKANQRLFAGGLGGRGWVVIFATDYPEFPNRTFVSMDVVEPSGEAHVFEAL